MRHEIEKTVLETLRNIKLKREKLEEIKDKLNLNKAELSSILILINENSLKKFEYETQKVLKNKIETSFKLISIGEIYESQKIINNESIIIPINYSAYRLYHTKYGPFIFKCKIDLQGYHIVFMVILKGRLVFSTNQSDWSGFSEFFEVKMDLLSFFGISIPEIQIKLSEMIIKS